MKPVLAPSAALVAGLALAALAGAARAEGRWYVSGSVGGYFRQDQTVADGFFHDGDPSAVAPGSDRLRFNPSALVGAAAVGYRLTPRLRLEAEVGYDRVETRSVAPFTSAPAFPELNGRRFAHVGGDDYTRFTGEVNGFYDIATIAGRFTPYLGAGVGGSDNHQGAGLFVSADGTPFTVASGASTEGFAMAEGGVAVALTPRLSLVPAYRYVHYFQGGEDVANVAKLGVRFSF